MKKKQEQPQLGGFHLEFRPKTFDEVCGNKDTIKALRLMLSHPDKPHVYLLYGPTGCGKTTLARLIAKELDCHDSEFFEINAANTRGIETIREVIDTAMYVPLVGSCKIYLFDEAHQITGTAAEALLKFLEDTPSYVYIILATTNPDKLLPTVKGRCEKFQVHRLSLEDTLRLIVEVTEKKGIEVSSKIVERIYDISDGCPREALLLLEKVRGTKSDEEANVALDQSFASDKEIIGICADLMNRMKNWNKIAGVLKKNEDEIDNVRRIVLGYMQSVLLNPHSDEMTRIRASEVIEIFSRSFWEGAKPKLVQSFYKAFLKMQELK